MTTPPPGVLLRAHPSKERARPRGRGGFTIVELLATIVIILVIATAVTIGIGNIQRADLPAQAGKIAAAVRYLYNLSVINNQSYRLVIDLKSGEYWGEEMPSESPCEVFLVETEGDPKAAAKLERQKGKKRKKGDRGDDEESAPPAAAFETVKDNMLTKRALEKRLEFRGVITGHHADLQEEGQVEVNFFPSGYVEKAYIYLGTGDVTYTIETRPLLGSVRIHKEKLEPASLFRKES